MGTEIRRLEGHTGLITGVDFTPDGLHVVSGSVDKTVRLWEVASGKELRRFEHAQPVFYWLRVTPDGKQIVSSSEHDKIVHIWDLESGKELRHFGYRGTVKENVWITAYSTTGQQALSTGGDNNLRLWDVDEGTMVRVLDGQSPGGTLSRDGRFALALGQDNTMRLYDVGTGKLIRRFQQGPAVFHGAFFSPDGQRVLAPYDPPQEAVGLWDVQSGKEIHRLAGNPGGVSTIRFSPDGRRALSAGRDGSVRLWGLPD
jgi:WD40 repeat protein